MLFDYDALQQKLLPGATVLYDGGQFEIAIRLKTFCFVGNYVFCTWFTKRQVNTFILKNKLAKSIEGSLHKPKSFSNDQPFF
jgi:hypothetical protein